MTTESFLFPTLFLSHGAPSTVIEPTPTHAFLKGLSHHFQRPKAILVVSAHWETAEPMITAHPHPETIYDFYGFQDELYHLKYAAQGAPDIAHKIVEQIPLAKIDPDRGLDHGAWVPLMLAYPSAEIPVLQLSVQPHRDAAYHHAVGLKLKSLSEQGVLIIGSGNATHNLRAVFSHDKFGHEKANDFASWLHDVLIAGDDDQAMAWIKAAPHALWNHPTPEHLFPLFTVLGAAHKKKLPKRIHQSFDFDVLAMDAYKFD